MGEGKITLAFDGGINQSADSQYLKLNEATESQNCSLDKGNLSLCYGNSVHSLAGGCNATHSLLPIYDANGDAIVTIMSFPKADYVCYQSQSDNVTIYANETDNIWVSQYSAGLRLLKKDGLSSVAGGANVAPKGSCIELYKERLWICGGELKNEVWFSAPYDADDYTMPIIEGEANKHGGFIDIPSWDGGKIVGIKGLFDDIVVFKTNNIFRIYGSDPSNFTVAQIADNIQGEIGNRTIKSHSTSIIFTAADGIYTFDGVTINLISQRVQDVFKNLPKDAIKNAIAILYRNKYILAIAGVGSTTNNVIVEYDLINDNFMIKKGFTVVDFIISDGKLLFLTENENVFSYADKSVTTFNSASISSYWKTGDFTFNELDKKKSIQALHFVAKGTGSIVISVISEKKVKTKTVVLTSEFLPYKIKLKNKGKLISFKFENVSGSDFTIKQPEVIYSI